MEITEKPKRKEKHKRRETAMDFVSRYSLGDCVYLLGRLDDQRPVPFAPRIRVTLTYLDENTYAFRLAETVPAPVSVYGYLNHLDEDTTYISGEAAIQWSRYYRDAAMGVALILALSVFVGGMAAAIFLPFFMGFMWFYRAGILYERARLLNMVGDVLSF